MFGSVSSPTLWGRFASLLGRSLSSICRNLGIQIYVDDPVATFDVMDPNHKIELWPVALLRITITGFPIKLEKSDSGGDIKWIGARIKVNDNKRTITVTIPQDKIEDLSSRLKQIRSKPVVGRKQLQSLAGALSFVAGIVPLMRPFLGGLWAALGATNAGTNRARNLVHTLRTATSLDWLLALLES